MLTWESIDVIQIPLLFRHPFRVKGFERVDRNCLILRCVAPSGVVIWSECSALPTPDYWYETVDTAWWALNEHLIPLVIQSGGFESAEGVSGALNRMMVGHPMAKAALEMAYWQLEAIQKGCVLSHWLSQQWDPMRVVPTSIPLQRVLGERDFETANRILSDTNLPIKLKVSPPVLSDTIDWLSTIPRRVSLDANGTLTPEMVRGLPGHALSGIEQPFPIGDWRSAKQVSNIPIVLDESISTAYDIQTAADTQSATVINIKASRVGGFGPALDMARFANQCQMGVMVGGMHESAVGRWLGMQLAAACANQPSELMPMSDVFKWDIGTAHRVDPDGMGQVLTHLAVDEPIIQARHTRYQHHSVNPIYPAGVPL